MKPQTSELISAPQICEIYDISRATLWRLCQRPDFPLPLNVRMPRLWDATVVQAFMIKACYEPVPGGHQGLTAEQLMTHFEISRATWWRWRKLPGFPEALPGRQAHWNLTDVDAFMRQQRKRSAPASSSLIASASAAR